MATVVAVAVLVFGWGVLVFRAYQPPREVKPEHLAILRVRQLEAALHAYEKEHGEYPAAAEWMGVLEVLEGYYEGETLDPWGREYQYSNEYGVVRIFSKGADPDDEIDDIVEVVHMPEFDYEIDSSILGTMGYIFSGDKNGPNIVPGGATSGDYAVSDEDVDAFIKKSGGKVPGLFEGTFYDPEKEGEAPVKE